MGEEAKTNEKHTDLNKFKTQLLPTQKYQRLHSAL